MKITSVMEAVNGGMLVMVRTAQMALMKCLEYVVKENIMNILRKYALKDLRVLKPTPVISMNGNVQMGKNV